MLDKLLKLVVGDMTMTRPPALTDEQADLVSVANSAGAPDQGWNVRSGDSGDIPDAA